MRNLIITSLFFLLSVAFCLGQKSVLLSGNIKNYAKQPVYLYQCYGDTLLLADSIYTDAKGKFSFKPSFEKGKGDVKVGLYKVILRHQQFFYLLNVGKPIEISTFYSPSSRYNIATDSLSFTSPSGRLGGANEQFYEFQHLQVPLNIANYFLLRMMRLYPLSDPFHKNIEDEYFKRYNAMKQFVEIQTSNPKPQNSATKIAFAYYQAINPDWKQPDQWRDSVIADHYFDYFNPSDNFYLNTNILPEKMDLYLKLYTNKRDDYGQPIYSEQLFADAAINFLKKAKTPLSSGNLGLNFQFCLQYLLKKFSKEHKEDAFLSLYDTYLKPVEGDCGESPLPSERSGWDWARKKADVLRNVQIGSIALDFDIEKGTLTLYQVQSNYTLLVFWASWCPHCTVEIPLIKKVTDSINSKLRTLNSKLITVAISLDTDKAAWQKYVQDNNLLTWLNTSELKGWKGEITKQYNVYATPTMFLLDKDKKIILRPISAEQVDAWFKGASKN